MSNNMPEKLGLALSGGGFRASFFHIGILAQMAEKGLLQSIEVISTVSGGSIIGALYYLHVKKLLESKLDEDISNQDYIDIVQLIEVNFLKATEKNIRMLTFADFRKNFKMSLPHYSRSDRIAELYNKHFYQSVLEDMGHPVEMQKVKIHPLGCHHEFFHDSCNDERTAKVPLLIINATTLNTGRNWQFTEHTMGEPPTQRASKSIDIDKKVLRLRRAKGGYDNMIKQQQCIPLSKAVAASACVPGIFEPLGITQLYYDNLKKEKIIPQLVDGGIFDNQGTESLIGNNCTHFIISDAAGQMEITTKIDTSPLSVLLRVTSIFQDRARTKGLLHLIAKSDSNGEKNIAFMDLRKGLGVREISWINENNKTEDEDNIIGSHSEEFGVFAKIQSSLSKMRTDLDAFTEVEAYSLMLDGYRMSGKYISDFVDKTDHSSIKNSTSSSKAAWHFEKITPWMDNPTPQYLNQLEISHLTIGKIVRVCPWLWIPFIMLIGVIGYYSWESVLTFSLSEVPVLPVIIAALVWSASLLIPKLAKIFPPLEVVHFLIQVSKRAIKALLLVLSSFGILLYLKLINPIFLRQGRVANLKK